MRYEHQSSYDIRFPIYFEVENVLPLLGGLGIDRGRCKKNIIAWAMSLLEESIHIMRRYIVDSARVVRF